MEKGQVFEMVETMQSALGEDCSPLSFVGRTACERDRDGHVEMEKFGE